MRRRLSAKQQLVRILVSIIGIAIALFFVGPLLWYIFAPFNPTPTLAVEIPKTWSLANFVKVTSNQAAMRGLFPNSLLISGSVMILAAALSTLAAYGLSRAEYPRSQHHHLRAHPVLVGSYRYGQHGADFRAHL